MAANINHFATLHKQWQNLENDNKHIASHYRAFFSNDKWNTDMINHKIRLINNIRKVLRENNCRIEDDMPENRPRVEVSKANRNPFELHCELESCVVRSLLKDWKRDAAVAELEMQEQAEIAAYQKC
ncbi:hypothetical protein L596_023847 [Steinernema carpocapsae]|nr:hypothetical protein L596_023847 [Steinernema carpocapsae]